MAELTHLWKEYKDHNSRVAKDKLLVEYSSLVKYIAGRMAYSLPPSVDRDDLHSAGIMGLIRAVETFEPDRDIKFETYASHKIRGAILDDLRALDWVPRSIRKKSRDLQKAYAELAENLGRHPYDDEVCEHLGLTEKEYKKMLGEVAPTTILSLEEALPSRGGDSKDLKLIDTIEDTESDNPLSVLGYKEVKRVLKESIQELPEKEKLVIALYHFEELTLKEIGVVLNISESRVSQIHSKTILKLRGNILARMEQ
ncbi:MAG: FliA/WhiG family RNA polymerase sigma factor [Fibrobacterota bacterium]